MTTRKIEPDEVFQVCRNTLGLETDIPVDSVVFLAALVRRAAGILCPCSPNSLKSHVLESLGYLYADREIESRIDHVIESLLIGGDLLEFDRVISADISIKGTWIFAASPAFVRRANRTTVLIGVTKDDSLPIPESLKSLVEYRNCSRIIDFGENEQILKTLSASGYLELSEESWLKPPKYLSSKDLVSAYQTKLEACSDSGLIEGLEILDPTRDPTYYSGRWTNAYEETGMFIGRRPRDYGADIWGLAKLEAGNLKKFLDFPGVGSPLRGCDAAWHLQMAIDACAGTQQKYRKRLDADWSYLDFFSPLPLWTQRRLGFIGQLVSPHNSLISFRFSKSDVELEEQFLHERLWLLKQGEESGGQ